ncbi:MFS transporter [Colletotrichum godetiae]|uniref:MFS transporter n=1 Tax=Colletotrichum godetiae TaxID=1209918 RepID=A0AAJ0ADC4_9PEZI|nr:MFS transporter [Colletotrichum godetiae]KAK1659546.1 MFS transporter [Colletotrichum godetiae]
MAPFESEKTAMVHIGQKYSSSSSSNRGSINAGEPDVIVDKKGNNALSTVEKPAEADETANSDEVDDAGIDYPKGLRLVLIIFGLAMAVFLVFLDMTLIATAIPAITNQFNSLQHVGWYGSAYMLSLCSFQLVYGTCFELFSLKWTFMVAIAFREVGLAVCGSAPNSIVFIVGRAITGIGCSGIIIGAWVVLAHSVSIRQRAVYTGFLGAFSGVGGIIGPLISGALTDSHLSWRWAFYVSIPLGVATLALIFFCFRPPQQPDHKHPRTLKQKLMEFDILGLSIFFACMICLLLALQWGGSQFAWNSAPMIGLLVAFGVLLISFIGVETWKGDNAALPPRLMKMQNIAFACFYAACVDAAYYTADIWLPIWFQAIKGESARESGIKLVPYVGGEVLAALTAGYLVTFTGWYNPFMLIATVLGSLGLGLMTTFELDTGPSKWVTFPVIAGVGIGLGSQQPMMGVQSTLALSDIPAGTAAVTLFQNLGPAILMSVANTVFANGLTKHLHGTGGLDGQTIADMGATNLKDMIPRDLLPAVIEAYNKALKETFTVPMAVAVISIIGVIGMKWEKLPG